MVKLKRSFALNPMATIAELATTDVYSSVEEFVANSYDADAERVDIWFNPSRNTLTLRDDGDGMLPEDLITFFQVGGSPKVAAPLSRKERVRIGKFGVGTILLNSLCKSYSLTTLKDGVRTEVKEKFNGPLQEGQEIPHKTTPVDESLHGTTIVMRDLLFSEDEDAFDLDKLRQSLAWGFLPEDEFDIYLNEEIVIPKLESHSEKFEYEIKGKNIGTAHIEVFYANGSTDHAGVHIYVNSRRVGRPGDFLELRKIRPDFERRLVVKIKANGLNDAIGFNRDYFDVNHPAYVGLQKAVKSRLKEVRDAAEGKYRSSSVGKVKRYLSKIRTDVEATLNEKGIADLAGLGRRGIIVSFLEEESIDVPGNLNLDSGMLQLNLEHPSLSVTPDVKPKLYERSLLALCVDTIAGALVTNNNLNSYRKKSSEIWKKVLNDDISPVESLHGLFKNKLYTLSELARFTDFGYPTWKRIVECEMIQTDDHERVKGKDVNSLIDNELNGFVSVYDLIQRVGGDDEFALEKMQRRLGNMGDEMNPFIFDFGNSSPCYFFYDLCADYVYRILMEHSMGYQEELNKLKNGFFSVHQLNVKGDSMTTLTKDQINKVMGNASKNRINIDEDFRRGKIVVKFGDFITACQIGAQL